MSGMSTGYHHPYRSMVSDKPRPTTVEMETDDVEATIHYLNIDGKVTIATMSYVGAPSAQERRLHSDESPIEIRETNDRGSWRFRNWLHSSFTNGYYEVGNILIPTHRLLQISKVVKERKEKIEVEKL